MAQPPRMKENVSRLHGTHSRMQGQGLVDTDNPDKVQVPTAVPVPVPALARWGRSVRFGPTAQALAEARATSVGSAPL